MNDVHGTAQECAADVQNVVKTQEEFMRLKKRKAYLASTKSIAAS